MKELGDGIGCFLIIIAIAIGLLLIWGGQSNPHYLLDVITAIKK